MACKGGKYTVCHSTFSDAQSHPIPAATVNSVLMSTGRSADSSGLPLHLHQLENVHYDGGVHRMLMPDDQGVLHIAILNEISPTETRNIEANVRFELYTRYILVCFQVLKIKVERMSGSDNSCHENSSDLVGVPVNFRYGWLPHTSKNFRPACSVLPTAIPTAGTSVDKVTVHLATCV
jgi:hypothetical protein